MTKVTFLSIIGAKLALAIQDCHILGTLQVNYLRSKKTLDVILVYFSATCKDSIRKNIGALPDVF